MARQETIKILRSEVLSATPSLTSGEVAVNLADRKFFIGGTGGTSDRITFRDELSTVQSVNGASQNIVITGDSASMRVVTGLGIDETTTFVISSRIASTSLTGVASFYSNDFSVSPTGQVSISTSGATPVVFRDAFGNIASPKWESTLTLTGGNGVEVHKSNTVSNTFSFTGITASTARSGVASFLSDHFTVSGTGHVSSKGVITINSTPPDVNGNFNIASATVVTGDGGSLRGDGVVITARFATTGVTGVASFSSDDFDVSATGHVTVKAAGIGNSQLANSSFTFRDSVQGSDTISLGNTLNLTGGPGISIRKTETDTFAVQGITATALTLGVASFNSSYFSVASGAVSLASAYQATGDSVQAGSGIAISANKTITNIGVTGFNGLTGNITVTGDGGSLVGVGNTNFTNRLATTGVTGVASFNSSYFTVSSGAVSLASAYQATGDTVITVPGSGIALSTSGKTDTIFNIGVTGFNGLTGNITVTGDGGSLVGIANNKFTNRLATTGVTGVASFNSTYFTVSSGAVSLASAYQATGDTIQAGSGIAISANKTIFNIGVTGIGFGSDVGLTGKVNITAGSNITITQSGNLITFSGVAQQVTAVTGDGAAIVGRDNSNITARLATTGVTGVASFLSTHFAVSGTGHVSLAAAYQATGDTVITTAGSGIAISTSGKTDTLFNIGVTGFNGLTGNITVTGDGGSLVGIANNKFTNRTATTGVTGVASFNSSYFSVSSGAVSLAAAYQATGDSVQAGSGIAISANKTITNIGITGVGFGSDVGLTGKINITAGSNITITQSGNLITFSGVAQQVTAVTGDGGAIVGRDNSNITARLATSGVTGVASFLSTHFAVSGTGHVSLAAAYQATGDTVQAGSGIAISANKTITNIGVTVFNGLTGNITVTGDGGSLVGIANNRFTNRLADASATGVASFNSSYFSVGATGHVTLATAYQATGDTVITVPGSGIALSTSGKTDTIFNIGVTGFNGLTGNITVTGDGGSLVGIANNKFTNRLATTGVTGVASFNSTYFTVSSGAVSLASAYQATGDTVITVPGSGIALSTSGKTDTIFNIGVTGFNGLTGNITVTGDGGSLVGIANNKFTNRLASTSLTGVSYFDSSAFLVNADGLVQLRGGSTPPCSNYTNQADCENNGCYWCVQTGQCSQFPTCSLFDALYSGMGISSDSQGALTFLYFDIGNLSAAPSGTTILSTDSILFYDASETGLIKTKRATISKLILDNNNLFTVPSKSSNQLTTTRGSSAIEFDVVLGQVAANNQGLIKGATAFAYIEQNTVRTINGLTGALQAVGSINGCSGNSLTITGTVNEVNVTNSCPTITIGLPDNVTIPYISGMGATFTGIVNANLFIGSVDGGTF